MASILGDIAPVRAWVNPGFEAGSLWGLPSGWSATCSTACTLPAPGAPGAPACFNANLSYVRVTDASYSAPNTNSLLSPIFGGSQACELFGACGCNWAQIEQTAVVPVTYTNTAVVSVWFAANFQGGHFGDQNDSRIRFEIVGAGGGCTGTIFLDTYTSASAAAAAGQAGFYYIPWTAWSSPPLPPNCQVTLRFTAWGCNYCGHSAWGYLDDVSWAPGPVLSPTASKTVPPATLTFLATTSYSPTVTLTTTRTLTPSESYTVTRTRTHSRTASASSTMTATRTASVTATPTNTPDPLTYTWLATVSFSETPTITVTNTRTATRTASFTATATISWTESPTRTETATRTFSLTDTETETDTVTETFTVTRTPTPTRTATVTETFIAGAEAAPNPWNPLHGPLHLTGLKPASPYALYALDGSLVASGVADGRGRARLAVRPARGSYILRVRSLGTIHAIRVAVRYLVV